MLHLSKRKLFFTGFCLLFVALLVSVEISNGKFWTNDLKVYYGAVLEFSKGNNPYGQYYGLETGFFKYPPTVLYLMLGMNCFPFYVVQLIHVVMLLTALIISIFSIEKLMEQVNHRTYGAWIYYAGFGFIVIHLVREIHIGNLNLILLCCAMVSLVLLLKNKENWSAVFLALAIVIKPFLILVILPLLVFKKYRYILNLGILGLVFFLVPAMTGSFDLWKDWLVSISDHGDYIISENSLTYLTSYYLGFESTWLPSLIVLGALLCFLFVDYYRINNKGEDRLPLWIAVFLAFTPNFFVTDTEHFMLSLPMIYFLLMSLVTRRKIIPWILFAIFIFCFSMNSNDLLKSYSNYLDEWGVLGLSNLAMISTLLFLRLRKDQRGINSTSAIR